MESWIFVPEGRTAVLANWRQAPHSEWAFRNLRRLLPTEAIDRRVDGYSPLSAVPLEIGDTAFEYATGQLTVDEMLARSYTDAFMVLKDGEVLVESYFNGMRQDSRHIIFSVSKSVLGLVFGVLQDRGLIAPSKQVIDYVPELKGSGYEGATVQHVLDMTVAVDFREDYFEKGGDVDRYLRAIGWDWDPHGPKDAEHATRPILRSLRRGEGEHGETFLYVSPNTDVASWVAERATGMSYGEAVSEFLWKPLGAEYPADITVERSGAARAPGGICATLRDVARFGTLMTSRPIVDGLVPAAFVADTYTNRNADAWARSAMAYYLPGGGYRNKWCIKPGLEKVCLAIGIHGQWIYANHDRNLVIVKMSSQPTPADDSIDQMVMAGFDAIAKSLG